MKKNILIIHYNTPYLTECLVRSINLFVKDAIIYIFDNSNEKPFTAKFDNVTVFDNTKGQIIDFNKWLEKYPNRFQRLAETHPKQYKYIMGELGFDKVLDFINVEYKPNIDNKGQGKLF